MTRTVNVYGLFPVKGVMLTCDQPVIVSLHWLMFLLCARAHTHARRGGYPLERLCTAHRATETAEQTNALVSGSQLPPTAVDRLYKLPASNISRDLTSTNL